jgi:hypothetical protein
MNLVSQILNEGAEGFTVLAKRIPSSRRAGPLTPQALWRWATKGIRRPDGQVVKLEVVRVAGRFLSSWPAVERFIQAQNEAAEVAMPAVSRSARKRQRDDARAAEMLEEVGI